MAAEGVDHAGVETLEGLEDADAGRKGRQRGLPRIEKEPRRNQGGEEIAHSGHGENGGEDLY